MSRDRHDWTPQLAWFIAGIFATGAVWYFLSQRQYTWTVVAFLGSAVFVALAIYLLIRQARGPRAVRKQLATFLAEAQGLRQRLNESPLPIADHNDWVNRASAYLDRKLGPEFAVRFSDFSGMTFYGDGSEKSKMSRSLEGRSRRLHEFISEIR